MRNNMEENGKKKANSQIIQDAIKLENIEIEKKDIAEKEVEKEQRRTTRFTAILAIVAVVGTICTILFKAMSSIISIWPQKGFIHICIHMLFALTLAICLIILLNIVKYIFIDLNRYDVEDNNYIKYDKESDKAYSNLFLDFKIYTVTLIALLLILIIILCVLNDPRLLFLMAVAVIVWGIVIVRWFKEWKTQKDKKIIKDRIKNIVTKLILLGAVGFFVYVLILAIVTNRNSYVQALFDEKGTIEISNQIANGFEGLDIEIYTFEGDRIYSESVETNQLYIASENKYIINEISDDYISEAVSIDDEKIYWKYLLDLNRLVEGNGRYYLIIKICETNERVELINTFTVENGTFIYAQDDLEKSY